MIILKWPLRTAKSLYVPIIASSCRMQSFITSGYHLRHVSHKSDTTEPIPDAHSSVLQEAPKAYGKDVSEYTPKPLDRPIGFLDPPRPGENTGIDFRTWKQRRDDFVDYDKHLVRRSQLKMKMATPYFREWSNMRFSKGKSFLAPLRLFRADKALYFPNFFGKTLVKDNKSRDTTPILNNKISIVGAFSSAWGENQAASFISKDKNPDLHEIIAGAKDLAQIVQINFEDNALKAMIIKLFMGNQRKKLGPENWDKYFLVEKGLTMELRDMIGLLNSKVGYIYLLDRECKIRWAGCGICEDYEREGLLKGVRKLIDDTTRT